MGRLGRAAVLILLFFGFATNVPALAQKFVVPQPVPPPPAATSGVAVSVGEGSGGCVAALGAGGGCAARPAPVQGPAVGELGLQPTVVALPPRTAATGAVVSLAALRADAIARQGWRPINDAVYMNRRLDAGSYPWLIEAKPPDLDAAPADLIGRNRDRVEAVIRSLPPEDGRIPEGRDAATFFAYRAFGGSLEQAQLFGDLLYVRALVREGRHADAAAFVASIRAGRALRAEGKAPDRADRATFFGVGTLKNAILYYQLLALARLTAADAGRAPTLAARYLENRPAVPACRDLFGDIEPLIVAGLRRLADPPARGGLSDLMAWHARRPEVVAVLDGEPKAGATYLIGTSDDLEGLLGAVVVFETGRALLVEAAEARARYREHCRRTLETRSTPAMQLFHVLGAGGEVLVETTGGHTARLTDAEYQSLVAGDEPPADHPLAALLGGEGGPARVLWTSPLMMRGGRALAVADDLAFALQRAYPGRPVYRDPLTAATAGRVEALNALTLAGPEDVTAVVDAGSFHVADHKLVQNIEEELAKRGITVRKFDAETRRPWQGGSGKALIVLSGHASEELAAFLRALGEVGYFQGNYVLLLSCQRDAADRPDRTRRTIDEVINRHGALGAFGLEGQVRVDDLEPFLLDLAEGLKGGGRGFGALIQETLRANGLNGLWTVCRRVLGRKDGGRGDV